MFPTRYVTAAHTATGYAETHPRPRPASVPVWQVTALTEADKPRKACFDPPSTGPAAVLSALFAKLRTR